MFQMQYFSKRREKTSKLSFPCTLLKIHFFPILNRETISPYCIFISILRCKSDRHVKLELEFLRLKVIFNIGASKIQLRYVFPTLPNCSFVWCGTSVILMNVKYCHFGIFNAIIIINSIMSGKRRKALSLIFIQARE